MPQAPPGGETERQTDRKTDGQTVQSASQSTVPSLRMAAHQKMQSPAGQDTVVSLPHETVAFLRDKDSDRETERQ